MKTLKAKLAVGVLSVAVLGMSANTASASLLGHLLGGTGNVVNNVGNTVEEVFNGAGATVGAGANLLTVAGLDLSHHGIDVSTWTDADAQVLLDLQLLGVDVDALVETAALLDASIITNDGIDVDALLCLVADGSLDVAYQGTSIASADVVASIGATLGFVVDTSGIDLHAVVGDCDSCGTGPNGPNGPGDPTSVVPEPATAALGLMSLGAMAMAARRRRNK